MKNPNSDARRFIRLDRYQDATPFISGFVNGKFNLLFLIGRSGLGKTQMVKQALEGKRHTWIDCHSTKLAMYIQLYKNRDLPVVLDDEHSMMTDPGKLDLLNALTQTNPVKTLRWNSMTHILDDLSVPPEFDTTSPVLIITNELRVINPQVKAMLDRGLPLVFQPSSTMIHEAVADWFKDREIYNYIGEWLAVIPGLSMRDYVKAKELKEAGLDWQTLLHRQWKTGKLALVARLRSDPSFSSEEDRVRAFEAKGGGSRPTYFRYVKKLNALGFVDAGDAPDNPTDLPPT